MAFVPKFKAALESLPSGIGRVLAHVPYSLRPVVGPTYRRRAAEIASFQGMTKGQKQEFVFRRVSRVTWHAWNNVPFYRSLYGRQGFHPSQLLRFQDLRRIPIVTKSMLQGADLAHRSSEESGRFLVNTGGSSGSPLQFYILPDALGHEWAHMLRIWGRLGYRPSDLKLGFMGRSVGDRPVKYDSLRHQFSVNVFKPFREIAEALRAIVRHANIRYLHGYPSALYDFARACAAEDTELVAALRRCLRGAFLSSEYPLGQYRDEIERVFGVKTVSWYGHTERAIMAGEGERPCVYEPMQTYGFTEAVPERGADTYRLIGTSYYNMASPLIRYDTGDAVCVVSEEDGLLHAFEIQSGRRGDFIVDRGGKSLPLTALIFGRHHRIFDAATFVQIAQEQPGRATLIVTISGSRPKPCDLASQFDLTGVDVDFAFEAVQRPVLTASGKVVLNVSNCGRDRGRDVP